MEQFHVRVILTGTEVLSSCQKPVLKIPSRLVRVGCLRERKSLPFTDTKRNGILMATSIHQCPVISMANKYQHKSNIY